MFTLKQIKSRYRQLSWYSRALPDFIIIGAQKSGTTSLYHYLSQHPQLIRSYRKEVHFFDGGTKSNVDNFVNGQAWYRAHFPLRRNINTHQKTFEASPLYIFNPLVPKRIADLISEVKLIAILRNPTERAISHYFHSKRKGFESLPIMEALQAEEKRLKSVIENEDYKNHIFRHHTYKSRGLYKEQLVRYFNLFAKEQILVMNSEKFFSKPSVSLKKVFKFVGVDADFKVTGLEPKNVANNRTDVPPTVYEYLNSFFRANNRALYELVGENYGW